MDVPAGSLFSLMFHRRNARQSTMGVALGSRKGIPVTF